MNERDLNTVNQIDMECRVSPDDDDMFVVASATDDRDIQSKTGIIINLNDEDDLEDVRTISANCSRDGQGINIQSNTSLDDFHDYNSIDMETKYLDDDDEEALNSNFNSSNPIFFDDDQLTGVIDSEMLQESKRKTTYGEVEADYWKELAAKHKKTNKKGAYNTSFHIAGNPELERDTFNKMMGVKDIGEINHISASSGAVSTAITGSSESTVSAVSAGSCSESKLSNNCSDKLLELFDIIGFEVFKNSDSTYVAIDKCDIIPSISCESLSVLVDQLKPYITDCIIYPLQTATGNHFTEYEDWVNWYDADMQDKFPKCASDVEICNLLSKHLDKCFID